MKNVYKKALFISAVVSAVMTLINLSGCSAIGTAIEHRNLETSTKMSKTIFLPPEATVNKFVYIQVKNTSDQEMNIQSFLAEDLQAKGYTVTKNYTQASQVIQVNILQAGKATQSNINSMLNDGYGGALAGVLAGAALNRGNPLGGGAVGGIVGGLAGATADALVKDVTYSITTDVQISIKLPKGTIATQKTEADLEQGTGTNVTTTYSGKTDKMVYQTRIISWADQVNLKFEEARPVLEKNLAQAIANIF